MRRMILLLLLLLLSTENVLAQPRILPPLVEEWSNIRSFQVRWNPLLNDPLFQDQEGNLHITTSSFSPQGQPIQHTVFTPSFEILSSTEIQLPPSLEPSLLASTMGIKGPIVVSASRREEGMALEVHKLDQGGAKTVKLDTEIPGTIQGIFADVDAAGNLHLVVRLRYSNNVIGFRYHLYNQEFQLVRVSEVGPAERTGRESIAGGKIVTDSENNAWILTSNTSDIILTKVTSKGEVQELEIGNQTFAPPQGFHSVYMARVRPPSMTIDQNDVLHLVWHKTIRGQHGENVAINYMQYKNGRVLFQDIISSSREVGHFPSITHFQDKIYIAWEQMRSAQSGGYNLMFSVFTTHGKPIHQNILFDTGRGNRNNPIIFGAPGNNYTAFWWSGGETIST